MTQQQMQTDPTGPVAPQPRRVGGGKTRLLGVLLVLGGIVMTIMGLNDQASPYFGIGVITLGVGIVAFVLGRLVRRRNE